MWMFVVGAACTLISVLVGFGMGVSVADRSSKKNEEYSPVVEDGEVI